MPGDLPCLIGNQEGGGGAIHQLDEMRLDRPSPLSIPVIAQIGRISVDGGAAEALIEEAAEGLYSG